MRQAYGSDFPHLPLIGQPAQPHPHALLPARPCLTIEMIIAATITATISPTAAEPRFSVNHAVIINCPLLFSAELSSSRYALSCFFGFLATMNTIPARAARANISPAMLMLPLKALPSWYIMSDTA